jgi:hypothetical protein
MARKKRDVQGRKKFMGCEKHMEIWLVMNHVPDHSPGLDRIRNATTTTIADKAIPAAIHPSTILLSPADPIELCGSILAAFDSREIGWGDG